MGSGGSGTSKFITPSVHLCLQHVCHDPARQRRMPSLILASFSILGIVETYVPV